MAKVKIYKSKSIKKYNNGSTVEGQSNIFDLLNNKNKSTQNPYMTLFGQDISNQQAAQTIGLLGQTGASFAGDDRIASNAFSNIGKFASLGSNFGPIGTGVGAGVGIIKSVIEGNQMAEEERRLDLQRHMAMLNSHKAYGRDVGLNPFAAPYGGYINYLPYGGVPIQAEQYQGNPEMIQTPNGQLEETNATTSHENMSDNEITDYVPKKSFVYSARNNFTKKEREQIYALAQQQGVYINAELIEALSKPRGKTSPAEMAKKVDEMIKSKATPGRFGEATKKRQEEMKNMMLAEIAKFNEVVNPKNQQQNNPMQMAPGGVVGDETAQEQAVRLLNWLKESESLYSRAETKEEWFNRGVLRAAIQEMEKRVDSKNWESAIMWLYNDFLEKGRGKEVLRKDYFDKMSSYIQKTDIYKNTLSGQNYTPNNITNQNNQVDLTPKPESQPALPLDNYQQPQQPTQTSNIPNESTDQSTTNIPPIVPTRVPTPLEQEYINTLRQYTTSNTVQGDCNGCTGRKFISDKDMPERGWKKGDTICEDTKTGAFVNCGGGSGSSELQKREPIIVNPIPKLPPVNPILKSPSINPPDRAMQKQKQAGFPCSTCAEMFKKSNPKATYNEIMEACASECREDKNKKPFDVNLGLLGLKYFADSSVAGATARQKMYNLAPLNMSPTLNMEDSLPFNNILNQIGRTARNTGNQMMNNMPWGMAAANMQGVYGQAANQSGDAMNKINEMNTQLYNQKQNALQQQISGYLPFQQAWETDRTKRDNNAIMAPALALQSSTDATLQYAKDSQSLNMQLEQLKALLKTLGMS